MSFVVDLHVHTKVGSGDSRIAPAELTDRSGVDALVLAEHTRRWSDGEIEAHQGSRPILLSARECETAYGHVVVIGASDEALATARTPTELRSVVDAEGGVMILAHPFRHFPSSWNLLYPRSHDHWGPRQLAEWPPERLAEHPAFRLVDAIEVLNSGCTPRQNALALAVASVVGLPCVGASDAHDASFIGYHATEFAAPMRGVEDLMAAIRAGHCRPVTRGHDGSFVPAGSSFDGVAARES
jgi:predicted metal-dependent phosphoesterase TrpH